MKNRMDRLRHLLEKEELDAYLVTNHYNLRYLTRFTGTTAIAVIAKDQAFFITDSRYTEQAKKQVPDFEIVQNRGPIFDEAAKLCDKYHWKTLAIEENDITFAQYAELEAKIASKLVPTSGLVEGLRQVKDQSEIELIEKAVEIADKGFMHVLETIQPGLTEIEVANQLDFFMRSLGATGTSFDTILASGKRSALPHGVASEKVIEEGDLITLDFGCYYQGYVSDMTRTFAIGEVPDQLHEIYNIVYEANRRVREIARPGMRSDELDSIARDYITEQGYGDYFGHGTGHGIGLEIHEGPVVSPRSEEIYEVGNVITDEPGIYLPGIGGVRIEDDLLLTPEGNRVLTKSPRDLIVL